jgi:hypothetical protein
MSGRFQPSTSSRIKTGSIFEVMPLRRCDAGVAHHLHAASTCAGVLPRCAIGHARRSLPPCRSDPRYAWQTARSFVETRGRDARVVKETITTVGRAAIGLEFAMSRAFEKVLRARDLLVAGYSGLDSDISDLIARTPSANRVPWIRYASRPHVRIHRWRAIAAMRTRDTRGRPPSHELELLASLGERGLRRREDIVLVEGETDAAANARGLAGLRGDRGTPL